MIVLYAIALWTAAWLLLAMARRSEDLEGPASEDSAYAAVVWAFVWLWWPMTLAHGLFRRRS